MEGRPAKMQENNPKIFKVVNLCTDVVEYWCAESEKKLKQWMHDNLLLDLKRMLALNINEVSLARAAEIKFGAGEVENYEAVTLLQLYQQNKENCACIAWV